MLSAFSLFLLGENIRYTFSDSKTRTVRKREAQVESRWNVVAQMGDLTFCAG